MYVPLMMYRKPFLAGASALVVLVMLVLAGCGGTGTPPSTTPTTTSTPSTALTDPAHWGPIVGLHDGDTVEGVSLGHLLGDNSQQALVTVRIAGAGGFVTVYVYDQITKAQPTRLFSVNGLLLGEARISPANTLLTAQAAGAAGTTHAQLSGLVQDVYREFKWSASAKTFEQVVYAGMFPDLTRWQAEADQARVSAGQDSWKLDAAQTTVQWAHALFQWPLDASATVVSGGGASDSQAVVHISVPGRHTPIVVVKLQRFDEVATNGLWEVTEARGEMWPTLTSPHSGATVTSPVTVTGTDATFEGNSGTVYVFDRLYAQIGRAKETISGGDHGVLPTTTRVTYTSDFQGGAQEGILAIYQDLEDFTGGGSTPAAVAMIKVLLRA